MRPYYYFICVHSSIGLSPYTVRIKVLSRFERNCIRIQNISNDIYAVPFINPYKILKFSFVYFKSKSEIFSDFKRLLFYTKEMVGIKSVSISIPYKYSALLFANVSVK